MRLDRYLCESTDLSRSLAKIAIRRGRVTINGVTARSASVHIEDTDQVCLDDELIAPHAPCYIMLNKPLGYACSAADDHHPSALSLIELPPSRTTPHFAGRLDVETSGLLLVTDDGQWSHRITSPRHHCVKHYRATLEQPITAEDIQAFETGIMLHGEEHPTRTSRLVAIDNPEKVEVDVWISEGRYHQVRRMFAARGNHVLELCRLAIGEVVLDPGLAPGEWRHLTPEEVSLF